jgi:hypothetical protein
MAADVFATVSEALASPGLDVANPDTDDNELVPDDQYQQVYHQRRDDETASSPSLPTALHPSDDLDEGLPCGQRAEDGPSRRANAEDSEVIPPSTSHTVVLPITPPPGLCERTPSAFPAVVEQKSDVHRRATANLCREQRQLTRTLARQLRMVNMSKHVQQKDSGLPANKPVPMHEHLSQGPQWDMWGVICRQVWNH